LMLLSKSQQENIFGTYILFESKIGMNTEK
jgi:hypothetical protein